jgi:hypothetical protein
MIKLAFELYKPQTASSKKKKQPKVDHIKFGSKLGKITFCKPLPTSFIKDASFIHLYYDKEQGRIGIETCKEDESSIKIMGSSSKAIMIKRFLKYFDIELKDGDYPIEWENGMITFKV